MLLLLLLLLFLLRCPRCRRHVAAAAHVTQEAEVVLRVRDCGGKVVLSVVDRRAVGGLEQCRLHRSVRLRNLFFAVGHLLV